MERTADLATQDIAVPEIDVHAQNFKSKSDLLRSITSPVQASSLQSQDTLSRQMKRAIVETMA
jgi:hypothetical protein